MAITVNWDDYPIKVELCFRTQQQRDYFMAGLSDGFGENDCELLWPYPDCGKFEEQKRCGVDLLYDANAFRSWEDSVAADGYEYDWASRG